MRLRLKECFLFNFSGGPGGANEQMMKQAGLAALALGVLYYLSVQGQYREISWKEFVNSYLLRGKVDRCEVVNNKWVRIRLTDGSSENQILWFAIGSPDTFERNLENAQIDSGTEPANFTPVIYR